METAYGTFYNHKETHQNNNSKQRLKIKSKNVFE